jgi:hypothetical protein
MGLIFILSEGFACLVVKSGVCDALLLSKWETYTAPSLTPSLTCVWKGSTSHWNTGTPDAFRVLATVPRANAIASQI